MWNDIRNRSDELKSNKVVSCLMEGATSDALTGDFIADTDIDSKISLTDIAVPVDADSSQLSAVAAASAGRSFVLHGPPGTGKSQTITNMIANALYHGKAFCCGREMAALSVVQKRLANIGIDPFCLELHSNKTSKSAVLAELNKSLETARVKSPEQHAAVAQKLAQEKAKLNFVIEALHESAISVNRCIRLSNAMSSVWLKRGKYLSAEMLCKMPTKVLLHDLRKLYRNMLSQYPR